MNKKSWIRTMIAGGLLSGSAAPAQEYLSPCDLDLAGQLLVITAHTGNKLLLFNTNNLRVVDEIPFDVSLNGTAISSNGKTFYVVGGGYDGEVFRADPRTKSVEKLCDAGHTPNAPVLSPDGKTLYVCNRFDNEVAFIDTGSGEEIAKVPVLREPTAADITPNGRYLYVANHIPDGPADELYVASKISVIDTKHQAVRHIKLANGAEGVRGVKVSPNGKYVYAAHFMARFLVPTTQLDRGWVSTDALSVIRVEDHKLLYTVLLDDMDMGFPNPWAIGFSGDGNSLLVTAAGSHEVSLINLSELNNKVLAAAAESKNEAHLNTHNDLSFLNDIRQRIQLPGNGPRAIAVRGSTAYIANYFSDSLDIVDFSNMDAVSIRSVELNPDAEITDERQGEIFFNDAELCFQKWLSCATCHPDARTDALNWDLLNDGIGNPKNAKSMLLSHQTPRAMWLGVRADAETGVRAGLKYIQFTSRPEEDAEKIDAYLKSLTPEPSPYLVDGEMSPAAKRGEKLFETMSCAKCHPKPLFTNLQMYDIGTTSGQDAGRPVDTPSLVELWRTAPYLHDGRAANVRELLTTDDHADILKETEKLGEEELQDLEEYLLSL